MATQSINWANIAVVNFNGTAKDRVNLNSVRLWERVWTPSSSTVQVDNGYWTQAASYQLFHETSISYGSTFTWNPWNGTGFIGYVGPDYIWLTTGSYPDVAWVGQNVTRDGYYTTEQDPAYWTSNWQTVTTDTSHYVYFY